MATTLQENITAAASDTFLRSCLFRVTSASARLLLLVSFCSSSRSTRDAADDESLSRDERLGRLSLPRARVVQRSAAAVSATSTKRPGGRINGASG